MRPLLAAMRKVGAATKGALRPLRAAEAWLSSQPPLLFVIVYLVTRLRIRLVVLHAATGAILRSLCSL